MSRQDQRATPATSNTLHAAITAALLSSAVLFATPSFAADDSVEWKPERAPNGPVLVVVGLAEQRAQIFRNGVRIGSTPVSTGRQGHSTPTGLFTILEKKRKHFSNLYDDAPMPNMQRLTWDGIALHAGRLPGYPASHGCIRLPHEVSDKLFGVTARGSLVAVVDSFPPTPVLDMTRTPTDGDTDRNRDAVLPSAAAGSYGPVSVVLSTSDGTVVVLRNGVEIGRAAVDVDGSALAGERLYVSRHGSHWEEVPTATMTVGDPRDEFAAGRLRVDPQFGKQLETLLVPGTTVLITDQSIGGAPDPTSSGYASVTVPLHGELSAGVDAAP